MLQVALIAIPFIIGLCVIRKCREHQWGVCDSKSLLTGRVFLITGSNSGIGKEVAKNLAARDATVIMACRNTDSAKSVVSEIRKFTKLGSLVVMHLDLSSLRSVREFAREVLQAFPKIHCLINNAGVYYPTASNAKTADGHEINFGVNYLGHFLLTNLLMKRLKESAPSRIVIVSSNLHESGLLDINDLDFEKRKKDMISLNVRCAYCTSKLANVYHSRELAARLKGSGVSVYALCPGFTFTNLFRQHNIRWWQYVAFCPIAFFFMRTCWQGAQTVLHCATSENLQGMSGEFFRNCKRSKSNFKFDHDTQKKLWQKSLDLTKAE